MRPRIIQNDDQIGFFWATPTGEPTTLPNLVITDDEPDRLIATHLEALDDALIIAASRFGELLGGGRRPDDDGELADLLNLHRVLDLLCRDYAMATELTSTIADVRAGKIIGTAALFSICAREPLGLLGPAPFEGELDEPAEGVIAGFGQMRQVDPDKPWAGGRWVLETESGQRFPLTLSIMLFESSGVNKDASRKEHRDALLSCVAGASDTDCDPIAQACGLDWLLYDWLMAHREDADSAAIEIPKGHESDAGMIVAAAAASVGARAQFDPGLGSLLPGRS